MVIDEQQKLDLEGLVSQGHQYLAPLGVRETSVTCLTKQKFKQEINTKLRAKNTQDILGMCKGYRKIYHFDMIEEEFELHESCKLMTLAKSRILISIAYSMNRGAKLNFGNDHDYKSA